MNTDRYNEPAWIKEARKAPLRTPAHTRQHDSRLRHGQSRRGNAPSA